MGEMGDASSSDNVGIDRNQVRQNNAEKYFMGDLKSLNDWLQDKHILVQFPNWVFRGIGAPIFLNNPISGLVIMIAMFVADPWVALNGLAGLICAILTSLVLGQPRDAIVSGEVTFHGLLVGIAVSASVDKGQWYPWSFCAVLVLAPISVYVASGLSTVFSSWNLPVFNLPFNVTAFAFIAAVRYGGLASVNPNFPLKRPSVMAPSDGFDIRRFDWGKAFLAIPLSVAQVYGSSNVISGALLLVAMLVASPIVLLHGVIGSFLSVFIAIAVAAPPAEIYTGEWALNAMLTCGALGGTFWVLTPQSHVLADLGAIFATVVYGAGKACLHPVGLSPMAFPFVFTASLFLALTSSSKLLRRVPLNQMSYPELHLRMFKINSVNDQSTA